VAGAPVTAAAATTLLPAAAKKGLPANFFDRIGQRIKIEAAGSISSLITTPGTARFDVRLGGTVVFDGQAILLDSVAAHSNVGWELEINLTLRAIGTAGNFYGTAKWTCEDILGVPATAPKGVLVAMLPWNATPGVGGNFDTTTTQVADLFFTQTVATGSITLQAYELSCKN
jgi:hypothetical protein